MSFQITRWSSSAGNRVTYAEQQAKYKKEVERLAKGLNWRVVPPFEGLAVKGVSSIDLPETVVPTSMAGIATKLPENLIRKHTTDGKRVVLLYSGLDGFGTKWDEWVKFCHQGTNGPEMPPFRLCIHAETRSAFLETILERRAILLPRSRITGRSILGADTAGLLYTKGWRKIGPGISSRRFGDISTTRKAQGAPITPKHLAIVTNVTGGRMCIYYRACETMAPVTMYELEAARYQYSFA